MSRLKIQGKEIRALGYPEGPVISIAMNVMEKNFKHHSKEKAFEMLKKFCNHHMIMQAMKCWDQLQNN
jgi:tRNA-splicing ligase RtcB